MPHSACPKYFFANYGIFELDIILKTFLSVVSPIYQKVWETLIPQKVSQAVIIPKYSKSRHLGKFEKSTKVNDFKLETVSDRSIFSSSLWRETSPDEFGNELPSIAEWIFGTNSTQKGFKLVSIALALKPFQLVINII